MGHLLSTKSSLVPLIDRLNRYPIGLVDNAKLREILSLLFDPREAFVASRFPLMEATLEELCEATGLPAPELDGILESMANKGKRPNEAVIARPARGLISWDRGRSAPSTRAA